MLAQTLLTTSFALVLVKIANAEYEVEKYCQLTPAGTRLPSLESCQVYYTCLDNMVKTERCEENFVFDKNVQSCIPLSESNCYYGLPNPCVKKDKQFSYCSNGCNWYNWCVNEKIAGNGTCPVGQKFYAVNGSCIFGECDSTNINGVQDLCEIMQDGAYFGDFENCRAWHRCSNMYIENGLCEHNLVFDVKSGYCLENTDKMCERTHNVIKSLASGPPDYECNHAETRVGDENICSIYYTCEPYITDPGKFRWVQKRCKGAYFDVIDGSCNGTLAARTFPGCDRCEFKTGYARTYWTNVADPTCTKYYTCKGGQRVGNDIRECHDEGYFNEAAQACVGHDEALKVYMANNGACQDYICSDDRICNLVNENDGAVIPLPDVDTNQNGNSSVSVDTNQNGKGNHTEPPVLPKIKTPGKGEKVKTPDEGGSNTQGGGNGNTEGGDKAEGDKKNPEGEKVVPENEKGNPEKEQKGKKPEEGNQPEDAKKNQAQPVPENNADSH